MLSKSKHLCSLSRQVYSNYIIHRVSTRLQNAFCTFAEPLEANDSPTIDESHELLDSQGNDSATIGESPELPDWVKSSDKNTGTKNKNEDDDFVPPSVSYWIENHMNRAQASDMKIIVNDIVESDVDKVSKILKNHRFESPESVTKALEGCDADVSPSLVEQILRRFSCEWAPAIGFFKWAEAQKGTKHSPEIYNLMVDNLGKMKKFEVMWDLMEEMKKLKGYVTLDTMTRVLRRLAKAGKYEDAIEAFEIIELFGVDKDSTARNILMDALVKQGSVEHAERVYINFKEHIPVTSRAFNILVHGWCKTRQMEKAKKTVDEMKEHGFHPDSVTYTNFIEAYCREKDFRKVDATLEEMKRDGFSPTIVTYTIIMHGLAKAKEMDKAMKVYEEMKENNISPDASFYNVFINALSKSGRLKDSDDVFEDMSRQGVVPDSSTYNTLILIAAQNSQEEKALNLLLKMEENKCKPDLSTYAPLLKMCFRLKRMKVLSFLLSHMFKNDVSLDLAVYSSLVSQLSRNGELQRACSFFEESVLKGFVPMNCIYEILIDRLEKKGMSEEKKRVEELMSRAKETGFRHS